MNEYRWYDGDMSFTPHEYKSDKIAPKKKRQRWFAVIIAFLVSSLVFIFCVALFFGSKIFNANSYLINKLHSALNNNINTVITVSPQNINTQQANIALPSVVNIENSGGKGGFFGANLSLGEGTGVVIRENGYILTSLYVVESVGNVSVKLYDGKTYTAEVFATDTKNNIAILKINAKNLTPITLGDSSQLAVGDYVSVIGNCIDENLSNPITGGTISGINNNVSLSNGRNINILQVDASAIANSIGGLVLNEQGELIGITTAIMSSYSSDIGIVTPINDLKDSLASVVSTEEGTDPAFTIGISGTDEPYGVIVDSVGENTPAAKAGLKAGDLIIKINDKTITSCEDITNIKNRSKPGDTLIFSVYRDGEVTEIPIILE